MMASILGIIAKFAPLSIIIAALGFLQSVRQARIKRDHDDAVSVRGVLNSLGTKTYVLEWSLLGSPPSLIAASVMQIREAVEERIGKAPADHEIAEFLSEQLLAEGIVEKSLRDSKVIERFQSEALEFGKLRADLGNRLPLVQAAFAEVETRLRMLFLLDSFLIFAMRNKPEYKELKGRDPGMPPVGMSGLHRLLLQHLILPDREAFSEACGFLQEFCEAAGAANDRRVLSLTRRRHLFPKLGDWWSTRRDLRGDDSEEKVLLKKLKENAGEHFNLLSPVVAELSKARRQERVASRLRQRSALRILGALDNQGEGSKLAKVTRAFLAKCEATTGDSSATMFNLLQLRARGIDDPDIDALLASASGAVELLKSALDRGATGDVGSGEILARHK